MCSIRITHYGLRIGCCVHLQLGPLICQDCVFAVLRPGWSSSWRVSGFFFRVPGSECLVLCSGFPPSADKHGSGGWVLGSGCRRGLGWGLQSLFGCCSCRRPALRQNYEGGPSFAPAVSPRVPRGKLGFPPSRLAAMAWQAGCCLRFTYYASRFGPRMRECRKSTSRLRARVRTT